MMINNLLKIALFCFYLSLSLPLASQAQSGKSKVKAEAVSLLSRAKERMSAEDYSGANKIFREMLNLNTVLPTEMCYFFANTLYHLQQFDNSLRFVEKYENLAGTGGEYALENSQLKGLLEEEMKIIRECDFCNNQGYLLENCQVCKGGGNARQACMKCLGHKEIKCINCSGEGVVIHKNHFGQKTYQTCQVCEGSGKAECIYCKGKGHLVQDCQYCSGSGKISTTELCTHPPKAN